MPRFANMLTEGMRERGHRIEIWSPVPVFYKLPVPISLKKWLGYIDQYIIFPKQVKKKLKAVSHQTIFVFTDHALGPWIPLVQDRPHVIHCHDFLAQRSALGEIPENRTTKSGQFYQAYIRNGYRKGKNFVSVSQKTQKDLHRFLILSPLLSEIVYNGMNQPIQPIEVNDARRLFGKQIQVDLSAGYLLHVGGNQWYKNRASLIQIYNAWRQTDTNRLPLIMIGTVPSQSLLTARAQSSYKEDIYFLSGLDDEYVQLAYSGASLFLFPSLAEGFGWPIAEAMATGCPVVTTNEPPMTEVGGNAAIYIPRCPLQLRSQWAADCAFIVNQILELPVEQKKAIIDAGYQNVRRFNTSNALDKIEAIYQQVLANYSFTK